MVAPASKGLIPQPVLMSDLTLRLRRAPVKRKISPHFGLATYFVGEITPIWWVREKFVLFGVDAMRGRGTPLGQIFNRTPPVLDQFASMMMTLIAASATGLFASMITTTGTTIMPSRAGTG